MSVHLKKIERIIRVGRWVGVAVSGIGVFIIIIMTSFDVFFRYVLDAPFPASVEISELIQPYIVLFPCAFALYAGAHVRVTLFTQRLKGRAKVFVEVLPYIVGSVFFAVFTYWSWMHFWESFIINEIMLASIRLYWWIGKLAMPVGLFLMTVECLYRIFSLLNQNCESKG
jgi:TRAP-type C4-dicarboxylate transport system permease small subunit